MSTEKTGFVEVLMVKMEGPTAEEHLIAQLKTALQHVIRCHVEGCQECAKAYELTNG